MLPAASMWLIVGIVVPGKKGLAQGDSRLLAVAGMVFLFQH
jgi:hypothetical protein